ncbi:putative glycosyl transferase [Thermostichus vulcanus NIES-2134]|nr:putative glycosyl transferase [Thermostichus vulcanus NIES-2134]
MDQRIENLNYSGKAEKPQVSIGMPVHNGAKFIRGALDSLLSQTFTDFELIISDNASTDDTEAICCEYVAKDKRIRYVRQKKIWVLWLISNMSLMKRLLSISCGQRQMIYGTRTGWLHSILSQKKTNVWHLVQSEL